MNLKTNPALRVRASRGSDVDAILRIYAQEVRTGTASFELVAPSREEMAARHDSLVAAGYPYLVAELGDMFAGYAYVGPYRTRPAYRFTVENSVYVAKQARKRGVGLQLLSRLIADCEADRFRQMVAIIGDSRHEASIRLHNKAGFQLVGTIQNVGLKFGGWLDSVLMQRALGEGANTIPTGPMHDA
jgi:phosphinothricin acetyltransferase